MYEFALQRIEELLPVTPDCAPEDDPRMAELVIVSGVVEEYENIHYPIAQPTVGENTEQQEYKHKKDTTMKQTVKVLAININHDDLMDISHAFHRMISKTDIKNMAEAMNVLGPKRSFEVTEEKLNEEIQKCYGEIMDSLGPVNDDGSIDIDLLEYPSVGAESLGFILNLKFDREKKGWLWTLNLEVSSLYVYPKEEPNNKSNA